MVSNDVGGSSHSFSVWLVTMLRKSHKDRDSLVYKWLVSGGILRGFLDRFGVFFVSFFGVEFGPVKPHPRFFG